MRVVEIRSYQLTPGSRALFHQLLNEHSLPLMNGWGMDVIAFGPSLHDECSYYLIRAFADPTDLATTQASFYASAGWRNGPREAIVSLIASDSNVVIALSEAAIAAMRNV